jgi:hypothetical protein
LKKDVDRGVDELPGEKVINSPSTGYSQGYQQNSVTLTKVVISTIVLNGELRERKNQS